jgi:hypothetical protein
MKRFKTILAALVLPMLGHAQEIVYEYDAAGNRIARHLMFYGSQAPPLGNLENLPQETIGQTVSIGPNPTTGQLTVSLSRFGKEDVCNLLLVNAAGQTLIKQSMTTTQTTLDLTQYTNGYYLLKVDLNENVTTYKIIKK